MEAMVLTVEIAEAEIMELLEEMEQAVELLEEMDLMVVQELVT